MPKNERYNFTGNDEMGEFSEGRKYRSGRPEEPNNKAEFDDLYKSVNGRLARKQAQAEQERMEIEHKVNTAQQRHRKATSIKLQEAQNKAEQKRLKDLKREIRAMKYSGVKSAVESVDKVGRKSVKVGKKLWQIAKAIDQEVDKRRGVAPKRKSTKRKSTKRKSTKRKSTKRKSTGKKKSQYVIINGKAYPRG